MGWFTRIDKLTDSFTEVATGKVFDTEIYELQKSDLSKLTQSNGWNFEWSKEYYASGRKCYKLVIEDTSEIQGLISMEVRDNFFYLPLIESAPPNVGKNKKYQGVLQSLTAFACKRSFNFGFEGVVSFEPKTALIQHYKNVLDAVHIGNNRLVIFEETAQKLVSLYFKDYQ